MIRTRRDPESRRSRTGGPARASVLFARIFERRQRRIIAPIRQIEFLQGTRAPLPGHLRQTLEHRAREFLLRQRPERILTAELNQPFFGLGGELRSAIQRDHVFSFMAGEVGDFMNLIAALKKPASRFMAQIVEAQIGPNA